MGLNIIFIKYILNIMTNMLIHSLIKLKWDDKFTQEFEILADQAKKRYNKIHKGKYGLIKINKI